MAFGADRELPAGLADALSASQDRRASLRVFGTGTMHLSPTLEVRRNVIDPTDGSLFTGGSSYVPGMPLVASSSGLAGLAGTVEEDLSSLGNFSRGFAGLDAVAIKPGDALTRTEVQEAINAAHKSGAIALAVAKKLSARAEKLADLADSRAKVAFDARQEFKAHSAKVEQLDTLEQKQRDQNKDTEADKTRAKALALGKLAVRYQKVNALATPLAENGAAQATILQNIALAVQFGKPELIEPLYIAYLEIGKGSDRIRTIRQQQILKAKQGLQELTQSNDTYERELDGLAAELAESCTIVPLNGLAQSCTLAPLGSATPLSEYLAAFDGRSGYEIAELGRFRDRLKRAVKKGAKKLKKKVLKPVGKAVKTAAKSVAKVAGQVFVGLPCKVMQSKVGKGALTAVAAAIGSFYAGPAGTAVGTAAAKNANDMNDSVCNGLKKIGLTEGKFRPGQVKGAIKASGKLFLKQQFDPKTVFKSAKGTVTQFVKAKAGEAAGQLVDGAAKNIDTKALTRAGSKLLKSPQIKQAAKTALKTAKNAAKKPVQQIAHTAAKQAQHTLTTAAAHAQRVAVNALKSHAQQAVHNAKQQAQHALTTAAARAQQSTANALKNRAQTVSGSRPVQRPSVVPPASQAAKQRQQAVIAAAHAARGLVQQATSNSAIDQSLVDAIRLITMSGK